MRVVLSADRLRDIVGELVARPGHEKVRALVYSVLVDGLAARSSEVIFERPLAEVRGRTDALLGETVFEFKRDLRNETRDAEQGLKRYLEDREAQTGRRFLGLATDGALFLTYELRNGTLATLGRFAPSRDRPDQLLAWLDATLAIRPQLDPEPDVVRRELGRDSVAYERARLALASGWAEVGGREDVRLKRQLWADLLQMVYGSDVDADDLFFQHTYLSVVAKTMATAVLGIPIPEPAALLAGRPFLEAGISGAVESDFFDWILDAASGPDAVARIARQVARFRLAEVRHDVLKGLYESLIDPEQRHDLGEYYTPDWLAARMCDRAIVNPLARRALDPACGSGTFLFHAIRRLLPAAQAKGMTTRETLARCVERILGIDVHPLAVTIARVTYLLALGEERLRERPPLSIPVYLGDSLQWNTKTFLSRREVLIRVPEGPPLYFPLGVTKDPSVFDAVIDAMLRLSDEGAGTEAFRAWCARNRIAEAEDVSRLVETYERLHRLHAAGRNHIWGYVARNLSRPIWLSSEEQRVDVVIGNPPWLSYRYMSTDMQERFAEESKRRGLWAGGKVATHQDLSAYFFARCVELYLRPGGVIAFVMPHAALTRRQFEGLRSGRFGPKGKPVLATIRFEEGWAFDERVQPLLPVPSCVLFARQDLPGSLPTTITECTGHLPRRDASPAEASVALRCADTAWPEAGHDVASSYRDAFRQGATVVPRMLFRVERVAIGRIGGNPAAPVVESSRSRQEKTPWRDLAALRGPVEAEFIRPLYVGESVAPFRLLEPVLAVIPWDGRTGRLLDAASGRDAGYPNLAKWVREAERLWKEHGKSDMTLSEQLDFYGKLTAQFPIPKTRVVYTASGTLAAAALLRDPSAVVDHKLYWAAVDEDEGRYLETILNSETARAKVAHLQSRGQWGARDFHKLLLELPFPTYDPSSVLHREIVAAAREAEETARAVAVATGTHFIRTRAQIRSALRANGIAQRIDALVTTLLAPPPSP